MKVKYGGAVNVRFFREDVDALFRGSSLRGGAVRGDSVRAVSLNIFPSAERFCSSGGKGEGFEKESFQGFFLERPTEYVQRAFPWGEERVFIDYRTLKVRVSLPALRTTLERGETYFCGMARGIASGHVIDELNLYFYLGDNL